MKKTKTSLQLSLKMTAPQRTGRHWVEKLILRQFLIRFKQLSSVGRFQQAWSHLSMTLTPPPGGATEGSKVAPQAPSMGSFAGFLCSSKKKKKKNWTWKQSWQHLFISFFLKVWYFHESQVGETVSELDGKPSSHLVSALKFIYGCSYFILLIPKKTVIQQKSTFWVLAYYTTSSIHGVGETTGMDSRSPHVQVGCHIL